MIISWILRPVKHSGSPQRALMFMHKVAYSAGNQSKTVRIVSVRICAQLRRIFNPLDNNKIWSTLKCTITEHRELNKCRQLNKQSPSASKLPRETPAEPLLTLTYFPTPSSRRHCLLTTCWVKTSVLKGGTNADGFKFSAATEPWRRTKVRLCLRYGGNWINVAI